MLVQFLALNRATGPYDEFLSLYGAERVLHGGLPYRDFFTMYGPAQFYLIAGFFKLFGVSALSGRIYNTLIRAAIVCAVYALTVSLTSRRWAIAAFSVTLLWLACDRNPAYNYSAYPALLASLLSCIFFSRFLHHRQKSQLLLAGILASIAATFRHDCGVYLSVTHLVLLAWIVRLDRRSTEPIRTTLTRLLRLALPYLGCVLLIAVPVYLAMLVGVGFQNIFFDLVYSPGFIYPKFRNMPFLDPDAVGKLHHPLTGPGGRASKPSSSSFRCLPSSRHPFVYLPPADRTRASSPPPGSADLRPSARPRLPLLHQRSHSSQPRNS